VLSAVDLAAVWLTLKLATVVTVILLIVGTPIAWWLACTRSRFKALVGAVVALPLVLPPTVLGFYLLIFLGPHGPVGQLTQSLGWGTLPFTFAGLVVASVLYSMPFVVQPLQQAFDVIGSRPLEVAATLRASPWDAFFTVVLPLAKPGFITASILGFCPHRGGIRCGADDWRQHPRRHARGVSGKFMIMLKRMEPGPKRTYWPAGMVGCLVLW
jgi:molybdate transport system permease protein